MKAILEQPKSFTVRAWQNGKVVEEHTRDDLADADLLASILEAYYGKNKVTIQFNWR